MASQLVGLFKTLAWTDFQGTAPQNSGYAGLTATTISVKHGAGANAHLDPTTGGLQDDVTVTITMDNKKSWIVKDQVDSRFWQFLLDHEQVHYDISALMARDLFIDLMALKMKKYKSQADLQADVNATVTTYNGPLQKIQDAYDADTKNGLPFQASTSLFTPTAKTADQSRWEGFRDKAFSELRPGGQRAPDGTTYKKRLMDVLSAGGVTW